MGFLGDLGKAIMGKPIGQADQTQTAAPEQPIEQPTQTLGQQQGVQDERGLKIIPEIEVKNLRSHRNGDKLRVTAWIANKSDQEIRIDETRLLGQGRQPGQFLSPRGSHELVLYDGRIPDNESQTKAQIVYRLKVNNDVFMENYRVNYSIEQDGKHTVDELVDEGPVRDI